MSATAAEQQRPTPVAGTAPFASHAPDAAPADGELHGLLMQAPVALCILSGPQHVFTFANCAYRALVNNRELVGKPLLEALPELRGQGFDTLLNQVLSTGVPFIGRELTARLAHHAEGESLIVDFVYTPKRNREGVVTGVLVSVTDVTDAVRARAESEAVSAQLATSEERLRQVVEASGLGVWEIDMSSNVVTANAKFRDLFGFAPGDTLTLEGCVARIHLEDIAGATAVVTRAMAGDQGGRYQDEYRLAARSSSDPMWIESRGQLRFDPNGKPLRLHGTVLDVSERKAAEIVVQQRGEFERQLIGIVSHDLRNPITAIVLGAAALLRLDEGLDEQQTKIVARVRNASERAARMVRDLLDFTRARLGGGIPIERQPMALHDTTREVLEEVEAAHPGRALGLRCSGDTTGQWDRDRIAQVVQNLVTNALTYGLHDSAVSVVVTGSEDVVVLSVHNEGPAISPSRLESIFLPLERATNAMNKADRSIGLGLYIVKQVVDAHGGKMTVESTADSGTTFSVHLPRGTISVDVTAGCGG